MNRLAQIRTRQAAIRSDLDVLDALEDSGQEEADRSDALLQEWDELDSEASPLQERADRIALVRSRMAADGRNAETTDPGDGNTGTGSHSRSGDQSDVVNHGRTGMPFIRQTNRNPYDDMESIRSGMMNPRDVRSRAVQAIEQYAKRADKWGLDSDGAQHATRMVEKGGVAFGTAVARQMLITGTPEYLAAFEAYLSDPGGFSTRAALSLTPANGGYLVPFTLDPTIILTNAGSANPYRQVCTIKTTATNNWNGVTSAGVTAEWTAEGVSAGDDTPTTGQLTVTPQKATAYLFGSFEVLSDSDFAAELPGLLADAKDRLEEAAFANGTGTGMPFGISVRAATLGLASGTAATGPTAASAYALMGALPARWRGPGARNAWLGNFTVINALRNSPKFTGSTESVLNENGATPTVVGKPIFESSSLAAAFTTGTKSLYVGDWRQYYIVDRVGMSVVYDPIVLSQTTARPTGQGAWYAFWRVGGDVTTATAFRVGTTLT